MTLLRTYLQSFMIDKNLQDLAEIYLKHELGVPDDKLDEAGKDLIGFFETLYKIDLRNQHETQPTT